MEHSPHLTRAAKRAREEEDASGVAKEGEQCVICLDTLSKHDVSTLPCGHKFHSKCMMKNIMSHNSKCPICRAVCVRVEDEEVDSSDSDTDESTILFVADRIEAKLQREDVNQILTCFHIPNGTEGLTFRQACELAAEQLTHETDDEDEPYE
jgi:hypothetical protein